MVKVGITGEMGSGKSYCSKLFEELGIPVFYSDDVAREVINTNSELKEKIINEFGNVYDDKGRMIPHLIRSIVFVEGSEDKLVKLNELAHPYVFKEYQKFCEDNIDAKFTLVESAILYESGLNHLLDKIIYVNTDEKLRIERTFKRSGFSEEEYHQRMKNQIKGKENLADFIISNNTGDNVNEQVKQICNLIYKL